MMQAFIQGIVPGLILSVLIGPVFFLLIQTSMEQGFKRAMIMESGIILADGLCIYLAIAGFAALFTEPSNIPPLTMMGGVILIAFGAYSWLKSPKIVPDATDASSLGSRKKLFAKGFLFNLSNPSVIFFWMGAVGIALPQYNHDGAKVSCYFAATLLTVFLTDVLKAILAHRIKPYISAQNLALVNRIASIAIIAFGFSLLTKAMLLYTHL